MPPPWPSPVILLSGYSFICCCVDQAVRNYCQFCAKENNIYVRVNMKSMAEQQQLKPWASLKCSKHDMLMLFKTPCSTAFRACSDVPLVLILLSRH
jgi:hypothetical protein